MSVHARIKAHRESLGMTHQQYADAVGVSRGSVQQWEKGETAPNRKRQPIVAGFMGITVAELMDEASIQSHPSDSGANYPSAQEPRAHYATNVVAINLENNPEYPAIRRVALKAQAGVSGYAVEYMNDDGPPIVFRRDWYASNNFRPEKMLAMRVAGESMVPNLHPGDLIVINTESATPKDGVAFVVAYEGEITVKRMVRDDGLWWLASDNADQRRYPRKKCNGDTQIIGEVVYRQTSHI